VKLTFDQARTITDRRNEAMMNCDVEAFLDLWADDCIVEGPDHYLEGKQQLRESMEAGWAAMKPLRMVTRSLAVEGDAMYYEFAVVWEVRSTGDKILLTGMTYHRVDARGRLLLCREYFDPLGKPRRTAAESPELADLMGGSAT
jgi:ketosteroid isomerase-like protein